MKYSFKIILFLTLLLNASSFAQYEMVIQNDQQTGPSVYEFEVFVKSTSDTINLTSYQLCFSFNANIANGGNLTFEYIPSSSELNNKPDKNNQVIADPLEANTQNLFAASDVPNTDIINTTGAILGRFRIVNSVTFAIINSNLSWNFLGIFQTEININNSSATNINNHTEVLNNPALPVELTTFSAKTNGSSVELKWQTATEINNLGFEVERRVKDQTTGNWKKIGFVEGNGNSNSTKNYGFKDKNPSGGKRFLYRLKQIDNDGTFSYSDEVEVELLPDKFELYQNYPNPFNPSTNIKFSIPYKSILRLDIFNIIGEHVATLLEKEMEAGFHSIPFNAANLPSGTYIYRIQAEGFSQTKKMLLIK